MYPSGLAGIASGAIDLDTSDIRVLAMKTAFTLNLAHDNLDDISADSTGTAVALAGRSSITPVSPANARALDANDTPLGALPDAGDKLVLYLHTGVASTSTLIAYLDGFSWTAGQSPTAVWSANGIVYLVSA
jgi:hypothetical protein